MKSDKKPTDFSIDAILHTSEKSQTTRVRKRSVSRGPRIPFSTEEIKFLEEQFCQSQYLSSEDVLRLSRLLNISEERVSPPYSLS